jgi:hypothetical protein
MTQNQERKVISQVEFDKKVDIEYAHYTYVNRMSEKEARQKAKEDVSAKFVVN